MKKLKDILPLKQSRILLIGESCKDVYHYGETSRISPEGPVPIFLPNRTEIKDGMAANVLNNLTELGQIVDFVTCNSESPIIKERFVDEKFSSHVFRADRNDVSEAINLNAMSEALKRQYDAVVISDYDKGFLPPDACSFIISHFSCPVIVDTKKRDLSCFDRENCIIKINRPEYDRLVKKCSKSIIVITEGKNGARVENKRLINSFPTDVFDVCGAGDVFLSAMTSSILSTGDLEKSLYFSNLVASISVKTFGNCAPKLEDISQEIKRVTNV